jgi:hypothetical protein
MRLGSMQVIAVVQRRFGDGTDLVARDMASSGR